MILSSVYEEEEGRGKGRKGEREREGGEKGEG